MEPQNMFEQALQSNDVDGAIRILSSVRAICSEENILRCADTADHAFNLLRFVKESHKVEQVIRKAEENERYAQLIKLDNVRKNLGVKGSSL